MNCPTCPGSTLVMTERSGIEIDYCPTCRGVWLDRGELDKIIERSTVDTAARAARTSPRSTLQPPDRWAEPSRQQRPDHDRSDGHDDAGYDDRKGSKKKRSSLLGELFDF